MSGVSQQALLAKGASGGGTWTTEKTYTLNTDSGGAGEENHSYRIIVPALSKTITKIRVTMQAPTVGTTNVNNVGVGIRSGTTDDCTATPTEILFSGGGHGFSIATGATILSDETNFAATIGDLLLVAIDLGNPTDVRYNPSGGLAYRSPGAAATYNTATATMTLGGGGVQQGVLQIVEVFG